MHSSNAIGLVSSSSMERSLQQDHPTLVSHRKKQQKQFGQQGDIGVT
jgi:hypothetical protein